MRFKIHARRFDGEGRIRCSRCNYLVVLPNDASVILFDNGKKLKVVDPSTNLVVHHCDRKMVWWCDMCERSSEPTYKRVKKKTELSLTCPLCSLGTLRQKASADDQ